MADWRKRNPPKRGRRVTPSALACSATGARGRFTRSTIFQKYPLDNSANQNYLAATSRQLRGRIMIVKTRWARDAMDAAASGGLPPDEIAAAYGEVVWSWRRDRGVYPRRPVLAWQR